MYIVDGKKYDENPALKLGGGSEGVVSIFPDDPDFCVKLYYEPDLNEPGSLKLASYRSNKAQAITKMAPGLGLPARFKLPIKPAYRDSRTVGGFLMGRVASEFVKIMQLLKMQYRVDNDINLSKICMLFANIFDDAALAHSKGLVFRDVNTGFILVSPTMDRQYVDTDSYSYPGFPSLATTELFCHPDLYGDLTSGGKLTLAKPKHDRFSLTVMFVLMALHGAHPFRMGTHSKFFSLRERATNGVTILDDDVDYPVILPPRESLSDDLLHNIVKILKRQADEILDTDGLRVFANELTTCPDCGLQYHNSRKACPKCQAPSVYQVVKKVIMKLFKTNGTILFVQVVKDALHVACRVNNELQIVIIDEKNQKMIRTGMAAARGARYRFFDDYLVICPNVYADTPVPLEVYKIEDNKIAHVTNTNTGALENSSALVETSAGFLYRMAGNTLLCGRVFGKVMSEVAVTTDISRNQTWFTVDRQSGTDQQVVFGYDRSLRDIKWFLAVGNSEGENFHYYVIDLPLRKGESQDEFAVYFNKTSVLLVRKTTYRGVENIHYSVIDHNGNVSLVQPLTEGDVGFEYWREIGGKLYQSSSVVHISGKGLMKQDLNRNTYTVVDGTEEINFGDILLRFGKTLTIVRAKEIAVFTSK
jgi:hypothetical protein